MCVLLADFSMVWVAFQQSGHEGCLVARSITCAFSSLSRLFSPMQSHGTQLQSANIRQKHATNPNPDVIQRMYAFWQLHAIDQNHSFCHLDLRNQPRCNQTKTRDKTNRKRSLQLCAFFQDKLNITMKSNKKTTHEKNQKQKHAVECKGVLFANFLIRDEKRKHN
mmetsp:Transcript_25828/g.62019  ORF Transcript_25828/g.62019 Transcript_25828/m.62019 type:complete len:165 (+) Transcript_25828:59-553(+)